ncbi:efflux RND transporter periplasmic adaptor subunit [Kovacikia minuta CCNUW1]|uniref:efflux RND transporter periplasmic adaptor subunit n=1 Tax=Kovacikia minuta TaxID=2931930 RepID=UPI001CCC8F0A|nr:efflux RND transporter periplasmic adaptor subunit [Kovacikia minuta]UBF27006.1 efflux RND transporter periplasmic adaptor subunit [Kovacikia minuta CCNUW1]
MSTQIPNQRSALSDQISSIRTAEMARFRMILLGAGAVLAGLLAIGIVPRLQRNAEINASAKEAQTGLLTVNTVMPHRADAKANITLPGNIQAVKETTIYARMDGYLSQRYVDIGDRVAVGQLLAEIDSPETDRQLDQARANLAQTRAAYAQSVANLEQSRASALQAQTTSNFNRVSSDRWRSLQQEGAVARQDYDEKKAAYDASAANVKAAQSVIRANQSNVASSIANIRASEANVERLQATQSYKRVTAPFNGVITARNIDTGALITAGSGGSNAVWLYKVAQPNTLRIFVDLPQTYVSSIRPGQPAEISVRELPKRAFIGKVTRTASALDTVSHTLRTEVQVNNPDLKLLPGMYAQVKFMLNQSAPALMVPANAIVVRSDGSQVAIVGADQKVHYQKVTIGRDYGSEVEIVSGLQGNEQLVVNPTDDVVEGVKVQTVSAKQKPDM